MAATFEGSLYDNITAKRERLLAQLHQDVEALKGTVVPERCVGIQFPCERMGTHEVFGFDGDDWETRRSVSLWYCDEHYAELRAAPAPGEAEIEAMARQYEIEKNGGA